MQHPKTHHFSCPSPACDPGWDFSLLQVQGAQEQLVPSISRQMLQDATPRGSGKNVFADGQGMAYMAVLCTLGKLYLTFLIN